jgi:hypothetical protein
MKLCGRPWHPKATHKCRCARTDGHEGAHLCECGRRAPNGNAPHALTPAAGARPSRVLYPRGE